MRLESPLQGPGQVVVQGETVNGHSWIDLVKAVWFHSLVGPRKVQFIETESRVVGPGTGAGKRSECFARTVSGWEADIALEVGGGDGVQSVRLLPRTVHLK